MEAGAGPPEAVIDLGTNTVLLLVGRRGAREALEVLDDVHAIGRLGEGVDAVGTVQPRPLERVCRIVAAHAARARSAGARRCTAYGTWALRGAANRAEVCAAIEARTGVPVQVLDGAEEAWLTFAGAGWGLGLPQRYAVIDIGGGSTEVAIGDRAEVVGRGSVGLGAVRLTERCFAGLPPGADELARARQEASAALSQLPAPPAELVLVGVAGTVTTLGALDQGLARFDAERLDGYALAADRVAALAEMLQGLDYDAIRALPQVSEQRADLITAGALILDTALARWGHAAIRVSTRGLRYGLLLRELGLLPGGVASAAGPGPASGPPLACAGRHQLT